MLLTEYSPSATSLRAAAYCTSSKLSIAFASDTDVDYIGCNRDVSIEGL